MRATGLRQCTPVNSDPEVTEQPLLGLSSGYVLRSADRFPKQGSKFPCQVHQSYLRDYPALKRSDVVDPAMRFTNPAPSASPVPAWVVCCPAPPLPLSEERRVGRACGCAVSTRG